MSVLDRRLPTLVFRKGLAKTPLQARQLIIHGHVSVAGRRTKFPSCLVPVEQERKIMLYEHRREKATIAQPPQEAGE